MFSPSWVVIIIVQDMKPEFKVICEILPLKWLSQDNRIIFYRK